MPDTTTPNGAAGNIIDLDALRAERHAAETEAAAEKTPPVLRFGGHDYTLPPKMPLEVLRGISMTQHPDTMLDGIETIIAALIPDADDRERFWQSVEYVDDLNDVVSIIDRAYGETAGNSPRPTGSSPKGGQRSKRTSRSTTRST